MKYVYLSNIILGADQLPTEWDDQAAVFYTWFESLGFNRCTLPNVLRHVAVFRLHSVTHTVPHALEFRVELRSFH